MAALVKTGGRHVLVGEVVKKEGHCREHSEPLCELLTEVWRQLDHRWLQYALVLTQ